MFGIGSVFEYDFHRYPLYYLDVIPAGIFRGQQAEFGSRCYTFGIALDAYSRYRVEDAGRSYPTGRGYPDDTHRP